MIWTYPMKTSKRLSPFDFVKSINEKTENLIQVQPDAERDYVPFMVNRSLSFSPDTILYANMMNEKWMLDKKMQYDFLYGSVRRRRRFDKWMKREEDDMIPLVMEIYKVNQRRAIEYLCLMNEDQKKELRIGRGGSNIPK
jgi:hypothetical protein